MQKSIAICFAQICKIESMAKIILAQYKYSGKSLVLVILFILISILGILCIVPFVALISGVWQADYSVLKTLFGSVMLGYVVNTLLLCAGVLFCSLAVGVTTAWFTSCYDFPLRNFFVWLLPISIIISPYMRSQIFMEYANQLHFAIYPWVQKQFPSFAPFINQWWNFPFLVWTLTLSLFPYVYIYAYALYSKNSSNIIDNARLLNCNHRSLFFAVGLPLAAPAIRLGTAVVLMDTLNEYGAIAYFGFPTISSAIFRTWFFYQDIGSAKLLATLVLLLVIVLVASFQNKDHKIRYDMQQQSNPAMRQCLPFWQNFSISIYCMIWIFWGFLLPICHFIHWATMATISPQLNELFFNTLVLLLITLAIGVLLAVPIAYLYHIRQSRMYGVVFHSMTMGYAIPSAVVGIAVLGFIYLFASFAEMLPIIFVGKTIIALVFAAVLRFFFVIAKPIYQGFHHHSQRYENAASCLGSRKATVFKRIALPLNMPFIFSGSLLLIIEILKEIPLTLILRPFNFNTLAINAYLLARDERLIASALPTLFIIGVGLICTLLLQWTENKWKPV